MPTLSDLTPGATLTHPHTDPGPWLTADEAAARLKITRRTLDRWRADSIVTAYKMGPRSVRFRCDELDALLTPEGVRADA